MEPAEAEKPKAKRMVVDPEVQAILEIDRHLSALEPATRDRALRWVNAKFERDMGDDDI